MKKIIIFTLLLFSIASYGQLKTDCDTTKFKCPEFFDDAAKYNQILSKYKHTTNKEWAAALKEAFPVDKDGLIHLTYVIKTDSIFDISEMNAICANWYNIAFSSANAITINDGTLISGTGTYYNIAQMTIPAIFYHKIIRLNASTDIELRFKENRIRINILCRHYRYISGDSMGQSVSETIIPGKAYPFVPADSNSNREVYSQAYINCICNSLAHARSFIDYVNKNFNKVADDDNW